MKLQTPIRRVQQATEAPLNAPGCPRFNERAFRVASAGSADVGKPNEYKPISQEIKDLEAKRVIKDIPRPRLRILAALARRHGYWTHINWNMVEAAI